MLAMRAVVGSTVSTERDPRENRIDDDGCGGGGGGERMGRREPSSVKGLGTLIFVVRNVTPGKFRRIKFLGGAALAASADAAIQSSRTGEQTCD